MHGWGEAQIIFVANELGDLRENIGKILAAGGKIGAASIGLRERPELVVSLGQGIVDCLRFF